MDKAKVAAGTFALVAGVILAPLVVIALAVRAVAGLYGWSPTRSWRLVIASWVPMVLGWLLWGWTPWQGLVQGWGLVQAGELSSAWAAMLPISAPLGVAAGGVLHVVHWHQMTRGGASNPYAAGNYAGKMWLASMRRARREVKAAGLNPMVSRKGHPVLGRAAMRIEGTTEYGVPADVRLLEVPLEAFGQHIAVVGAPGKGKTVLLLRAMRAWMEAAWLQYGMGTADRPLLIFLDCKGGRDGASTQKRFRRMAESYGLAPGRVGEWPKNVRLDLWTLPIDRMAEVLIEMVKADHPFFADVQDELVNLVIRAGGQAPVSSAEFIERMSVDWLKEAYQGDAATLDFLTQNKQHIPAIMARYRVFFRRIGRTFDAGRSLEDFDALILTVEGTANQKTAAAQAQGIVELVTDMATAPTFQRRVLFVLDEFSAISDRVRISQLMERSRSLGVGVMPVAQSFYSLGPNRDERANLLALCSGGVLLMHTPDPEELANLAGSRIGVEVGVKRLDNGGWGDEGTGRAQHQMVVPPDWIRTMGKWPGAVCYIRNGSATFGQVTPGGIEVKASAGERKMLRRQAWTPIEGVRKTIDELEAGLDPEMAAAASLIQGAGSVDVPGQGGEGR